MELYEVRKNADMTEGRGPMIVDSIWFNRTKATEYMNSQPGVMGRLPKSGSWERERWSGDWEIKTVSTRDEPEENET